jgi:ADP-heptose:LPS heptosyltransferase
MKVLVIRFSSIGDIVLTTPVVRLLKTQLEDAEVHYVTKLQYKSIVESNPYLDKIFYLDKDLSELVAQLKQKSTITSSTCTTTFAPALSNGN